MKKFAKKDYQFPHMVNRTESTGMRFLEWREKTEMLVMSFSGTNREFREWLAARTANVVGLAEYRKKKKTARKERQE